MPIVEGKALGGGEFEVAKRDKEYAVSLTDRKTIGRWTGGSLLLGILLFYLPLILQGNILPRVNLFTATLFGVGLGFSFLFHEVLHGLGFIIFSDLGLNDLQFGYFKEGALYIHCGYPVRLYVYRIVLLMPGVILGFIPSVCGLLSREPGFVIYGLIMLSGSAMDFAIVCFSRGLSGDSYVLDKTEEIGFEVIKEGKAKEIKAKSKISLPQHSRALESWREVVSFTIWIIFVTSLVVLVVYLLGWGVGCLVEILV